jgi:hypothetical protein
MLLSLLEDVASRRTKHTIQPVVTKTMMGSRPPTNMGAVAVHDSLKRALWRNNQVAIAKWAAIAESMIEGRTDPQRRELGICPTLNCGGPMNISDMTPGIAACRECGHLETTAKARLRALDSQPDRLVTLEEAAVVLYAIGVTVTAPQLRWRARQGHLKAAEAKGKARRRYWLSDIINPQGEATA